MTDRPALVQAVTRNPIAATAEDPEVVPGTPESSTDDTVIIKPVVSRSVRTPVAAPPVSDDTTIIITPAARRADSPTMLMAVVPRLPPVFVDPTGRRRSRLRLVAYALGALGLAYTALVGASFAGASVSPGSILPFVESTERPWQPPPIPAIIPDPTPTSSAPASEGTTVTSDPAVEPSDGSSSAGGREPLALGAAPGTELHHG